MKWFFIILLVINLVYLGWELDRQVTIDQAQESAMPMIPPHVKKLVLLRELPVPPAPRKQTEQKTGSRVAGGAETPAAEGVQESAPPPANVKVEDKFVKELMAQMPDIQSGGPLKNPGATLPSSMCFSYGPFPDTAQTRDLIAWFEERHVAVRQRPEKDREKQLFWIYLAPRDSADSARQAIEELKHKGIRDYRLIETGDLRNAISLGLFSTQALVNKRLNELKDKGYQPIVVPYRSPNIVYWLDVKLEQQRKILNEMFTGYPAHYNSVPVPCGEIAMTRDTP